MPMADPAGTVLATAVVAWVITIARAAAGATATALAGMLFWAVVPLATGWHADVPAADTNARLRSPFLVRNGMLVSLGEPRGHLITDSSYRDYRLEVEYRFPGTPGNAGVLVHASTPRALYGMFPRSIEVQMESGNAGDFWCILEDIRVPDMERRRGPRAQWGTTHFPLRSRHREVRCELEDGGASAGRARREKTMLRFLESNFAPSRRLAS